jgi:hypothetical protein
LFAAVAAAVLLPAATGRAHQEQKPGIAPGEYVPISVTLTPQPTGDLPPMPLLPEAIVSAARGGDIVKRNGFVLLTVVVDRDKLGTEPVALSSREAAQFKNFDNKIEIDNATRTGRMVLQTKAQGPGERIVVTATGRGVSVSGDITVLASSGPD